MRRPRYFCGLDVGTTKVCCVIGREQPDGRIAVEGVSVVPTRVEDYPGEIMENAQPKDLDLVADRIREVVSNAERMAGASVRVKDVAVGLAGRDLDGQTLSATVPIESPEAGVSERDLARVFDRLQKTVADSLKPPTLPPVAPDAPPRPPAPERSILQLIPHCYSVDSTNNVRKPLGLAGAQLTLFAHVVTARKNSAANVYKCVALAGYRPALMAAQGIASAEAILTEPEKRAGTILIDLGGGTTDFAAYLGGSVVASGSLNHGGEEITNEIARRLHIDPDVADDLKVRFARAIMEPGSASETFSVDLLTTGQPATFRREDITAAAYDKLARTFEKVVMQFEATGYYCADIGGGVKLTGGGSLMHGIEDLAARIFNLPTAIARPLPMPGFDSAIASPIYSTACGLLLLAQKANRPSTTDIVTNHTLGQKIKAGMKKIWSLYTGE